VLYLGTYLTAELTAALSDRTFADAGVEPLIPGLPDGVEVTMRQNDERRLLFIQNYTDQHAELTGVPCGANLLDDGKSVTGALSLEAYGCAIVELS
jgi:beta-galactosidase